MNETNSLTPNEQLAETIVAALLAARLIAPAVRAEVCRKLVAGTAREQDWCNWLEPGKESSR